MLKAQYKMWEDRQGKLVWKNGREEHKVQCAFQTQAKTQEYNIV